MKQWSHWPSSYYYNIISYALSSYIYATDNVYSLAAGEEKSFIIIIIILCNHHDVLMQYTLLPIISDFLIVIITIRNQYHNYCTHQLRHTDPSVSM